MARIAHIFRVSLCVLLVLGGAGLASYHYVVRPGMDFAGDMRIAAGGKGRLAFAESPGTAAPAQQPEAAEGPVYRSVPGASIIQAEPEAARGWLDPRAVYDAARLPFSVHVEDVIPLTRVAARDYVTLEGPEEDRTLAIAPGQLVTLDGKSYEVVAVRPFQGIVRYPQGPAMAEVSVRLREGAWTQHITVQDGQWRWFDPSAALYFEFFASEADAHAACEAGYPDEESARWGVVHSEGADWLTTFTPGTGLVTRDGTEAELLAYETGHQLGGGGQTPAIRVRLTRDGEEEEAWYAANAYEEGAPIRFEYPARLQCAFKLYAWREGHVLAAVWRDGVLQGRREMESGESWLASETPYELRLDGVLMAALAVSSDRSGVLEAVLERSGRRWRLREGEAVRLGDSRALFVHEEPPVDVQCTFSLETLEGEPLAGFTLGPGEQYRYGDWVFSLGPQNPRDPDHVTVGLRRESAWLLVWAACAAAVGIAGLMVPFAFRGGKRFASRPFPKVDA